MRGLEYLHKETPRVEKIKKSRKNVKNQYDKKRQELDRKRNRQFKRNY